jgi:hypothetical protein
MDILSDHHHPANSVPHQPNLRDSLDALMSNTSPLPMARAPHFERGEKECFGLAIAELPGLVGSAGRVIECGPSAGTWLASLLNAFERPKAGITLSVALEGKSVRDTSETAQISHISQDFLTPNWMLEPNGAGRTLVLLSGGAFGLLSIKQAFDFLENASAALSEGDFVAISVEHLQDSASLETLYQDGLAQYGSNILAAFGKSDGLTPRCFFDPISSALKIVAIGTKDGEMTLGTQVAKFDKGEWFDLGALRLFGDAAQITTHPDFRFHTAWHSGDGLVSLVLLQKL